MQGEGAPVVSVLPGGVLGPNDPYLGETNRNWVWRVLRNRLPYWIRGASLPLVDVREVAEVLAATLQVGRGPRAYVSGRLRTWDEAFALLRRLTGRVLPRIPSPTWVAQAGGRLFDPLKRAGLPAPFTLDKALGITTPWPHTDESVVRDDLGVVEVPIETSFVDTVRWMVETGHLTPTQAGDLAG